MNRRNRHLHKEILFLKKIQTLTFSDFCRSGKKNAATFPPPHYAKLEGELELNLRWLYSLFDLGASFFSFLLMDELRSILLFLSRLCCDAAAPNSAVY